MKRVLFITFDFPPQRTSGVYRHVGMLRHLLRYGWTPTVLTVEGAAADAEDVSLLAKLPAEVHLERTRLARVDAWENRVTGTVKNLAPVSKPTGNLPEGRLRRVLRWGAEWLRVFLYYPDHTAGWIPFAALRGAELHMAKRFHLIYTSSPPRSAPVVGLLLKLLFRVPWVCEFRDPWYPAPKSFRQKMDRWLQRRVVARADKIVVISEGNGEDLRATFALPAEKIVVVPNGYDEDDFGPEVEGGRNYFEPGCVHLSHFGTVYPRFSGQFFPAVGELLQESPELRQKLRINIVGFPDDRETREYASGALKDVVRLYPFIPHRESLKAMYASDCLLVFLASERTSRLSGLGKIYWYLRVGRPVLAVSPPGGTQKLVEEGQAGWVSYDREGIKRALRELLARNGGNGRPRPARPEFVARFRYDNLAGELSRVLDEVAR